jgi:hypothetical protein
VFAQIHLSKRALSDFAEQAIMAELVSDAINHPRGLFLSPAKTTLHKADAFRDTHDGCSRDKVMHIITQHDLLVLARKTLAQALFRGCTQTGKALLWLHVLLRHAMVRDHYSLMARRASR